MATKRIGCIARVCTCHDDTAWSDTASYPDGCSSCGCHRDTMTDTDAIVMASLWLSLNGYNHFIDVTYTGRA